MRPELDNAGPQMPVLASWQPLSTEGRRPGGDTGTEVFGAGLLFRACRPWCRLDSAFGDESVWEVEVRLPVGGAVETGAWGGRDGGAVPGGVVKAGSCQGGFVGVGGPVVAGEAEFLAGEVTVEGDGGAFCGASAGQVEAVGVVPAGRGVEVRVKACRYETAAVGAQGPAGGAADAGPVSNAVARVWLTRSASSGSQMTRISNTALLFAGQRLELKSLRVIPPTPMGPAACAMTVAVWAAMPSSQARAATSPQPPTTTAPAMANGDRKRRNGKSVPLVPLTFATTGSPCLSGRCGVAGRPVQSSLTAPGW